MKFKKVILAVLAFCILLSCVSCAGITTEESKEIASNLVGKTFKGTVEFDYADDWKMTWVFGEDTVSVTKEYNDAKGLPVIENKEFKYKVTGTYKRAKLVFPDTDAWNDMLIGFDADKSIRSLEHTDSVGTTRFYVK
jgi:hypothetical protein